MKRKICPICDLPVNGGNYCSNCRKMVRRPVFWEMDYYLNEKPIDNEKFESVPPRMSVPNRTAAPNRSSDSSRTVTPAVPGSPRQQSQPYIPAASKGQEQKKPGKKFRISLVGIATLFFLVVGALPDVIKKADRILDSYSSYETAAPFEDSGFTQLEEGEVIAAGIPCSGYAHFPADGKAIADAMGQYLSDNNYGYQLKPEDIYTNNYELETENGWLSYYETITGYYLEDEINSQLNTEDKEYAYQYVELNYDTATGEMHDYMSSLNSEEACLAYLEYFLKLTETAVSIPMEDSSIPSLMEGIRTGLDQEDTVNIVEGIFRVTAYRDEDMVRVAVSYNDIQTAENGEV